jgi:hypothetical protein
MSQTAAMLVDAFQPEGITTLAKDSIFMMPHLGVLAQVLPEAAVQVFERDCLVYLGTCIAPAGIGKAGKPCFSYQITGEGISESGEVTFGELKLLKMADGVTATAVIEPAKGFDVGEGPGKRIEREICGGTVGILLDGRGRPLILPEDRDACRQAVVAWNQIQGLAELN